MSSARSRRLTRLAALAMTLAMTLSVVPGCTGPAPIVDFYVDPATGSDLNPGTIAEPFKTLKHALGTVSAGHTVHLAAGTYDEANGEVWPTQTGFPPTAVPNVPDGVTITSDGSGALLLGPGGATTTSALVFDGEATVVGISVSGFLRGILLGQNAVVTLEDVEVTDSAREGVLTYVNASVMIVSSELHHNGGAGLRTRGGSVVTVQDSLIHHNLPGVLLGGASSVEVRDSDVYQNGTLASGGDHSGFSLLAEADLKVENTTIRENAFAGVNLDVSGTVFLGPGTDVHDNYLGVVVDGIGPNNVSLEFDGATVRNNDFEGVYWNAFMGVSFKMRNTAVIDNGDNGIFFDGDAEVIDLGTAGDPGNNDYSGNSEPLILDNRPGRAVADGTIITVSYEDTLTPCAVAMTPFVGPVTLTCAGLNSITISNANNRVHVVVSP